MNIRKASLILLLVQAACGDGGPSAPSAPGGTKAVAPAPSAATATAADAAETVLVILSGETGQPVPGATVVVAGRTYQTDDSGIVVSPPARKGDNIDVVAEGYLDRQTLYRSSTGTRIALWPRTSPIGLTPEVSQRLVYTGFGEEAVPGELALARPPEGATIYIWVEPDMNDVRVARVVDDAVAAMREAVEGRVAFEVASIVPRAGVVWHVVIDPDATSSDFIAITRRSYDGDEIVGAQLAFRTLADLTDDGRLMTHMMGYAFGLESSDDPNDRMAKWWERDPPGFSPKEALVMRLMLQRKAGNRWPDNDRSLGASALRAPSAGNESTRGFRARPR
jgi:hypothetical protein